MKFRPYRTVYRRLGHSWKWMVLSRWDDSIIASGITPGIALARLAVKQAHADLLAINSEPRSKRQCTPAERRFSNH